MRIPLLALIASIILSGCVSTSISEYQAFDGARATPDRIAVLHVPEFIYFEKFDDVEASYDFGYGGARILLLPGAHTADVRYKDFNSATSAMPISFNLKAGTEYFIQHTYDQIDYQNYIGFDIHECGSEMEAKIDQERKDQNVFLKYQPPCPKTAESTLAVSSN